jgi:hypothetical protein
VYSVGNFDVTFVKKVLCLAFLVLILSRDVYVIHTHTHSGTSVHEFNSFLEAFRHPKCS